MLFTAFIFNACLYMDHVSEIKLMYVCMKLWTFSATGQFVHLRPCTYSVNDSNVFLIACFHISGWQLL